MKCIIYYKKAVTDILASCGVTVNCALLSKGRVDGVGYNVRTIMDDNHKWRGGSTSEGSVSALLTPLTQAGYTVLHTGCSK